MPFSKSPINTGLFSVTDAGEALKQKESPRRQTLRLPIEATEDVLVRLAHLKRGQSPHGRERDERLLQRVRMNRRDGCR